MKDMPFLCIGCGLPVGRVWLALDSADPHIVSVKNEHVCAGKWAA